MHPPLADWTEDYVREVAARPEGFDLEKKASDKFDPENNKGKTQDELAKQVCAFANASSGVLIYGVADNGTLDQGVPEDGTAGGGRTGRPRRRGWSRPSPRS
jgi:predicted HTH transcriptional regulator